LVLIPYNGYFVNGIDNKPRCSDGTLNMKYKINKGCDKYENAGRRCVDGTLDLRRPENKGKNKKLSRNIK